MLEDDVQDDAEQAPAVQEDSLDEAKDTQINRMAGCARLGKWMLYATLVVLAVMALYRCGPGFL